MGRISRYSNRGCWFHWRQCLIRYLCGLGLMEAYGEEDGWLKKSASMIAALAFVPVNEVQNSFDLIINHADFDRRLAP